MNIQCFSELASVLQRRTSVVGKAQRHDRFVNDVLRLPFLPSRESVILVGGTNGKGSVSKILERLWAFSRVRVGLLTSPHLITLCERLVKDGEAISEERFLKVYQRVEAEHDLQDYSFSECLTLMAIYHFFHPDFGPPVERAIFEVGVGGLNDSVNAIPHACAVLTQVGSDHQGLLGNDLLSRFHHKIGIAPEGGQLFLGHLAESLHDELERRCSSLGCRTEFSGDLAVEKIWREGRMLPSARVHWRESFFETHTSAPAWIENLSLALTAFEGMGGDVEAILSHIPRIIWPGRWQYVSTPWHPHVLFSGDHNLEGWTQLVDWLQEEVSCPVHILFSFGRNKNGAEFFKCFETLSPCKFYGMRRQWNGQSLEELAAMAPPGANLTLLDADPFEAFRMVCEQARTEELVIVTGSLYGLGDLARALSFQGFHLSRA